MSLTAELDAFSEALAKRMPAKVAEVMNSSLEALKAKKFELRVAAQGPEAWDHGLFDADGRVVRISELLAKGPVALTFYRGGWCPYCNLTLRAWQKAYPELKRAGITPVMVSPQTADATYDTAERNRLSYPLLSDPGNGLADKLGLAFTLDEDTRGLYRRFGHPLPEFNGDDSWSLPVPATLVIAKDGRVIHKHIDPDFRRRMEPHEAIEAVAQATA